MSSSMRGLDSIVQAANLVEETGQNVLMLNTDDVVSRVQSRKKFNRIEELAESIKVSGQQQPIVVSPKNSKGKYEIQKGERRWRACKLLGVKVASIVNNRHEKPLEALCGELAENIQREDLEPMEVAVALARFTDEGKLSQRDIAKMLGKPSTYVAIHLSLLKLQDGMRERLYDTGLVTDPETLNNLRQLQKLDPEWVEEICDKAEAEEGLSRSETREWLRVAKKAKDEGRRPKDEFMTGTLQPASLAPTDRPGKGVGTGTLLEEPGDPAGTLGDSDPTSQHQAEGTKPPTVPASKQGGTAEQSANPPRTGDGSSKQPSKPKPGAKDKGWKDLGPDLTRIHCVCLLASDDDELVPGWLMTSRVDEEDGYVWVMIREEAEEKPVRVPAEMITVTSVRAVD